jgi:hypothetical protein
VNRGNRPGLSAAHDSWNDRPRSLGKLGVVCFSRAHTPVFIEGWVCQWFHGTRKYAEVVRALRQCWIECLVLRPTKGSIER